MMRWTLAAVFAAVAAGSGEHDGRAGVHPTVREEPAPTPAEMEHPQQYHGPSSGFHHDPAPPTAITINDQQPEPNQWHQSRHHDHHHGHHHGHHHRHFRGQVMVEACKGIVGSTIVFKDTMTPEGSGEPLCVMQGKTEGGGLDNGLICTGALSKGGWRDKQLSDNIFDEPDRKFECLDGTVVENGVYHLPNQWPLFCFVAMVSVVSLLGFILVIMFVAPRQGFSTKLHGCTQDFGSCLLTMWCPCVTYGTNTAYVAAVDGTQPSQTTAWLYCLTYSFIVSCSSSLACCLGLATRNGLRRKLQIDGTLCQDACIHCFAHPCALCQESREIMSASQGQVATTFAVQVPQGAGVGALLSVQTPQGTHLQVTVPKGVSVGDIFHIQNPAIVPVVAATVVPQAAPTQQAMHAKSEVEASLL